VAPEPTLVAACAECIEATLVAGAQPLLNLIRQFRSLDGRLRVDFGNFSILTNPAALETIFLDHLAMEARIILNKIPSLPGVAIPSIPGLPGIPGLPPEPNLIALGIAFVDGLEVEGMRYVFEALGAIGSWEQWISTKLQLPVFTKTVGSFGVRTCICKCVPLEPPAATFQIPTNYTVILET
jgi:hypothetical protein